MKLILSTILYAYSFVLISQPTISFTFDDGRIYDLGEYSLKEWNDMILSTLDRHEIKAAFFVRTQGMETKNGRLVLESWNNAGHLLANHTHTHPNFNKSEHSAKSFEWELMKADSILREYSNYEKLFRFPYLKEGNTKEKVDSIRCIMDNHGFKNGFVTIDDADWFVDGQLLKRLKVNANVDLEAYREIYLKHLLERATYYEKLSYELTSRHIAHTLLLHHNLTSALFLDDLINLFKTNGWKVISAKHAFQDPIFDQLPDHTGASLVWDLAQDSGGYTEEAPDSLYYKMEKLGL